MIKQEHLSSGIRIRYQRFVDIVFFLAISLVRAIVSQVMRLMEPFVISGLTDTLKRIIVNAGYIKYHLIKKDWIHATRANPILLNYSSRWSK